MPIVYIATTEVSLFTISIVPWIGFYYLIKKDIFVDMEATVEGEPNVPRPGLPAAWVEFFELNALLWGDNRYLISAKVTGINIW